ncbi:hypothetical protein WDW89_21715 [Deltaproteobacteria bacterium TL4]
MKKESFHLMAVPRNFTQEVLKAGGKFMKLKDQQWTDPLNLQLLQWNNSPDTMIHILNASQQRSYEMLGQNYVEDMSLCRVIFEQSRAEGYSIYTGSIEQVTCEECLKKINKPTTP